jgi:hypothetical protein
VRRYAEPYLLTSATGPGQSVISQYCDDILSSSQVGGHEEYIPTNIVQAVKVISDLGDSNSHNGLIESDKEDSKT